MDLSWSLRTFEGASLSSCAAVDIDRVRLCWQPVGDGGLPAPRCQPEQYRSFSCEKSSGVTRFELPTGPVSLFVEPVCSDGRPPVAGTFEVPPPFTRVLRAGEVANLDSFLIAVYDPRRCEPPLCTCGRGE